MQTGKVWLGALLILLVVIVVGNNTSAFAQGMWALSMHSGVVAKWKPQPWPAVKFGSVRLWDSDTFWYQLNPSQGVYDWSVMDAWLASANANHQQVLYTMGFTPAWASSNPNDNTCVGVPGSCDAPNDLNADGTGPNQHWKDYVTAVVQHSKNSSTGHIVAWEVWNEPFGAWEWNGTVPQMVRMASDAYAIIKAADPNALVLTPSFYYDWDLSYTWMETYLSLGAGQYADGIALHGYLLPGGKNADPELLVPSIQKFRSALAVYGQDKKPIWDTEASWGYAKQSQFQDLDLQAGWLARFYLLHRSYKISRLFWFSYNSNKDEGTLWVPDPNDQQKAGTLLKPGLAFKNVHDWSVGATLSSACTPVNGTVWSCSLTRGQKYEAIVLWDTSQSCSEGVCTTNPYTVGSQYKHYRTVEGDVFSVQNTTVPVGYKPILVENR